MTTINDFIAAAANDDAAHLTHPRLRDLQKGIASGKHYQVEIYRPSATVGLVKTKIYIQRTDGNEASVEHDWDEELNAGLIQLGIRAYDREQESLRFALGLRDALTSVEREYGNGYFNAVLLDIIKESDLDQYDAISEVLKHTYHDGTEQNTRQYQLCRDSIAFGISGRARELVRGLAYSENEVKEILPKAIAQYVDSRFSVSSRRQMGLM